MNSRTLRVQGGAAGFESTVGATAFDAGRLHHIQVLLDLLLVNRQLNDCGLELEVRPPGAPTSEARRREGYWPVRLLFGSNPFLGIHGVGSSALPSLVCVTGDRKGLTKTENKRYANRETALMLPIVRACGETDRELTHRVLEPELLRR